MEEARSGDGRYAWQVFACGQTHAVEARYNRVQRHRAKMDTLTTPSIPVQEDSSLVLEVSTILRAASASRGASGAVTSDRPGYVSDDWQTHRLNCANFVSPACWFRRLFAQHKHVIGEAAVVRLDHHTWGKGYRGRGRRLAGKDHRLSSGFMHPTGVQGTEAGRAWETAARSRAASGVGVVD